ncbi:MAG: hypothetical protein HWN68_10655, partial [Desulfobacterales bacterium]|nr:hypothetical protein [Desulfobacterales bacterium]
MCGKSIPLFSLLVALSVGLSVTHGQVGYLTEEFLGDAHGDSFDLAYSSVTFTPTSDRTSYVYSLQSIKHLPTDPALGTDLGLGDDDYVEVGFSDQVRVRIFNRSFSSVYVGSNGYVTFTQGDRDSSQTLEEHFEILRISGLYCDLNPPHTRSVTAQYCINRMAITWQEVPEYSHTATNTFQIEMFFDGRIRLSWLEINADECIVGLSNGGGLPGDFEETDFIDSSDVLLQATEPSPAHGAMHFDTWATLAWRPGDTAVSHDVYVGGSYSSVYNGTSGTFRGNQVSSTVILGFPGFPYPDGLVPGTTYYWRIDEVEADATTHRGSVWNFSVEEYVSVPILDEERTLDYDTELVLPTPADLTAGGFASELALRFRGDPSGAAHPIYVTIEDSTGAVATVIHPDPAAAQIADWVVWRIELTEFAGVDPTKAREVRISAGYGEPGGGPGELKINLCKSDPGAQYALLNIFVLDPDGKAIEGAKVSANKVTNNVEDKHNAIPPTRPDHTDRYGHCKAEPHMFYTYNITVTVQGNVMYDKNHLIEVNPMNLEITLTPDGGVQGGLINDDCGDAIHLSGNVRDHQFDTTSATFDGHGHCAIAPNIWYVYTATQSGGLTVSLCGSSYDTTLAVYNGSDCPPKLEDMIRCNDDFDFCGKQSQVTFFASAGREYLIEIGG